MTATNQEVTANMLVLGAIELRSDGGAPEAVATLLENAAQEYEAAGQPENAADARDLIDAD
jgi:hypothetical protein